MEYLLEDLLLHALDIVLGYRKCIDLARLLSRLKEGRKTARK